VSDVPELDAAGLPEKLGATDLLLHRGEANPRLRSGIISLEILDTTPDWARYVDRFEDASRRVLRLRQKVVTPTLPMAAARWVVDPDFNLLFHVRRVRVPQPGTLREVLDLAEVMLQSPLDISRPLWSAMLIEGLAGERAASLLHVSHAVTDGVGTVELFSHIYDAQRDPPPGSTAPESLTDDWRVPAPAGDHICNNAYIDGLPPPLLPHVTAPVLPPRDATAIFGPPHHGRARQTLRTETYRPRRVHQRHERKTA
jgi:diacylglycerol O-acyltransferase